MLLIERAPNGTVPHTTHVRRKTWSTYGQRRMPGSSSALYAVTAKSVYILTRLKKFRRHKGSGCLILFLYPCRGLDKPSAFQEFEVHEGDKVVSPMHRLPLPLGNIPGTLFILSPCMLLHSIFYYQPYALIELRTITIHI